MVAVALRRADYFLRHAVRDHRENRRVVQRKGPKALEDGHDEVRVSIVRFQACHKLRRDLLADVARARVVVARDEARRVQNTLLTKAFRGGVGLQRPLERVGHVRLHLDGHRPLLRAQLAEDGNDVFDDRPAAHVVQADLIQDRDILLRPQPRAHLLQISDAVQQRHDVQHVVRRRGLFQPEDQMLEPADVA